MIETTPITQIANTLKDKEEILFKAQYYEDILMALDELLGSIDKRIKKGGTIESYRLLYFIPVKKKVKLDDLQRAELVIKQKDTMFEIFRKKVYFEQWSKRKTEYEGYMNEIIPEMNKHYEWIYEEAVFCSQHNAKLSAILATYDNPDDTVELKMEFYLFLKQNVQKFFDFKKRKFDLGERGFSEKNIEK